jgi:hypothetical protein
MNVNYEAAPNSRSGSIRPLVEGRSPIRLQFLFAKDSNLASVDPGLMENVRRELLARPDCIEVFDPAEADAILLHEAWSFKEWRYIKRLRADPVADRFPQKLLTINGDDAATGLLRGVYVSIASNRYDPLLHRAVPYHHLPNETVLARADQVKPAPDFLGSWRGNVTSSALRRKMVKAFALNPSFKIETSDSWGNHKVDEKEHYVDIMFCAKFALCPTGWAAATFRIYESMALGICPVIMADHYVPPLGPDWPSFSIKISENKYLQLESILREREAEASELGQRARAAWDQYFCPDVVYRYYANALMECVHAPGERSAAAEFRRWNSWKMYWANKWTIPQRVATKVERLVRR